MTIVFLYRTQSSACSITERRAVKSFAETLSMQGKGLWGGGGDVCTKTSDCEGNRFFFVLFCFVDHTWRAVRR